MSNNNKKKDLIKILDTIIQNNSNNESNNILNQIGGKRYSQKEVDKMLIEALQHIISIYQNSINNNYMIKQKIYELVDAKDSTLPKTDEEQKNYKEQNGGYKSYSKTEVDSLMISYKIWDLSIPNKLIHTLKDHSEAITSLALSSDNKILYSGSNNNIKIWDLTTPNKDCIYTLQLPNKNVTLLNNYVISLALSLDGKTLYSGSDNGNINIWQ